MRLRAMIIGIVVLTVKKPQHRTASAVWDSIAAADEQHSGRRLLAQQLLQVVDEIAATLGRTQSDHEQRRLIGSHEPLAHGVRKIAAKRLRANV